MSLKEEIEAIVKKHLPIKKDKKDEFGEVFTPPEMIDALLDEFPPSIWKDSSKKWLDPANGIGNFPIYIFFRLMKGLDSEFPDFKKRAIHIIKNMLYMIEIDSENVKICKNIFKDLGAEPNIVKGDFLDLDETNYDIIIGNPPYNSGGTKRDGEKRLHVAFTKKALELLNTDGYLSFICPPNYSAATSTMNTYFKETKGAFRFIKIYSPDETHRLFKIQARVDAFIFNKGDVSKTKIQDEFDIVHHIDLDLNHHIPNFGYSIFEKLKKKVKELGSPIGTRSAELTTVKKDTFGCGKNKTIHLFISGGRRIFKTLKKHSLSSKPKILINGLGLPYVYYDKEGHYGITQTPIVILNPTDALARFMKSSIFPFVAWGLRLTGNNNLPYILNYIPLVKNKSSYEEILNLTKKEKTFIETNFPVPFSADKNILERCTVTRKKRS